MTLQLRLLGFCCIIVVVLISFNMLWFKDMQLTSKGYLIIFFMSVGLTSLLISKKYIE